jgi:hypothetical protein
MITRSEILEAMADVILHLEKQVTGFSRQQLETFLEVLNSRKNENMPVIVLSKTGKLIFKDVETKETRPIDNEAVQDVLDYGACA